MSGGARFTPPETCRYLLHLSNSPHSPGFARHSASKTRVNALVASYAGQDNATLPGDFNFRAAGPALSLFSVALENEGMERREAPGPVT